MASLIAPADVHSPPDYLIGLALLALVVGPAIGWLIDRPVVGIAGAALVGWLLFVGAVVWYQAVRGTPWTA